MFQLNKSQTINTIAFYPNELITGSAIILEFTQSYSNTVTGSIQAEVISNPQNTPYIIAQFSGSLLPSASGQYEFKIFDTVFNNTPIWNTTTTEWQLANFNWDFPGGEVANELISTDRAFISGSDVTPITEYVSPNENARYKVYLG
jgi:hypothetical protein